jgi:hypothetical protein
MRQTCEKPAGLSTVDQNLALQRDALSEAGCQKIFTEHMSGASTGFGAIEPSRVAALSAYCCPIGDIAWCCRSLSSWKAVA